MSEKKGFTARNEKKIESRFAKYPFGYNEWVKGSHFLFLPPLLSIHTGPCDLFNNMLVSCLYFTCAGAPSGQSKLECSRTEFWAVWVPSPSIGATVSTPTAPHEIFSGCETQFFWNPMIDCCNRLLTNHCVLVWSCWPMDLINDNCPCLPAYIQNTYPVTSATCVVPDQHACWSHARLSSSTASVCVFTLRNQSVWAGVGWAPMFSSVDAVSHAICQICWHSVLANMSLQYFCWWLEGRSHGAYD